MSQRREEKLLRLKREQREQERRRQEQHSKMLQEYDSRLRSHSLQGDRRQEELRKREEEL